MTSKEQILHGSLILFKKYGARKITMDELAIHLGISKKTLYQHFDNKQALVYSVTKQMLTQIEFRIEQISKNSSNALDEMIQIMEFTSQVFKNINPEMLFDLRNHFVRAWNLYQKHKKTCMYDGVVANIRRGLNEKLYRSDIDPTIIATMRLAQIDSFFNPEIMSIKKNAFQTMHYQTMLMFLHGLLSEKGNELLKDYKRKRFFTGNSKK